MTFLGENQFLVAVTLGAAVVVGVIVSLTVGSWWLLLAALAVHACATIAIAVVVVRLTNQVEKPDPVTAARLEDEGVTYPEGKLNETLDRS